MDVWICPPPPLFSTVPHYYVASMVDILYKYIHKGLDPDTYIELLVVATVKKMQSHQDVMILIFCFFR